MKLGDTALVTVNAPDLQASLSFYQKLGFRKSEGNMADARSTFLSDGKLLLSLEENSEPHSELTYFVGNLNEKVEELKDSGVALSCEGTNEAKFVDPNGLGVRLVEAPAFGKKKSDEASWSKCGRFYEASIEAESIDESIAFWNTLGFEVTFREPPTARWATLSDGNIRLGIYEKGTCPHRFKNPSLTYFEPDMVERIERLKGEGVEFIEEMRNSEGKVDNAIAEAPDGQYFFLFFYDGEIPE